MSNTTGSSTDDKKKKQATSTESRYKSFNDEAKEEVATSNFNEKSSEPSQKSPIHSQQHVTFQTSVKKSKPTSKLFKRPSFSKPKGLRREKVEVTSPTDENSSKEKNKEGKKKSTSLPRDLKVSFKKEKTKNKKRTPSVEVVEDDGGRKLPDHLLLSRLLFQLPHFLHHQFLQYSDFH